MWRNVKRTCRIYAAFSRHISNALMISIDLFSDPICPWCFIGKRRLEEALSTRPDIEIEINWHSFQLETVPIDLNFDIRTG